MRIKPYSELIKCAEELTLSALGVDYKGTESNFITEDSIRKMSSHLQYTILPFSPDEETKHVLGAIYYKHNNIYINNEKEKDEQLFTLCHEVCHAYLHDQDNLPDHLDYSIKTGKYDSKESEANMMSYEILMPVDIFKEAYERLDKDLGKISNFFGLTVERVLKRFIFLNKHNLINF